MLRYLWIPVDISLFYHATAHPEIYTLSLHDALPICVREVRRALHRSCVDPVLHHHALEGGAGEDRLPHDAVLPGDEVADRKSTRLNSSHGSISYAVFCLKNKNNDVGDERTDDALRSR